MAALFATLCFRADATTGIGIGHVMRCLALAQAWQDRGGKAVLATNTENAALLARLASEGIVIHRLESAPDCLENAVETARFAREAGAAWLVLDGYHFDSRYRTALKAAGLHLLVIDDLADQALPEADIILNQNVYATESLYAGRSGRARLLTGSLHALLRREFLPWRRNRRDHPAHARKILLTFGGSDANNATGQALQLLASLDNQRLSLEVVVGATNPHLAALQDDLSRLRHSHDVTLHINPTNLPELMAGADAAISAAGSTSWELACLGVPTVLVVIADCQEAIARWMHESGAAISLGSAGAAFNPAGIKRVQDLLNSSDARRGLAHCAARLVDGEGAARVAEAIATHPLRLRPATAGDVRALWELANDPVAREASYQSASIPWEEHVAWFQRQLGAPEKSSIYVAHDEGGNVAGVVRFAHDGDLAEISVNLGPSFRGRGLGAKLVRLGIAETSRRKSCREIRAWVKATNTASLSAFRRAGFQERGRGGRHGVESIEFCWAAVPSRP